MASTFANYGGTTGSRYRLWIDYSESNINTAANTSDVTCTIRMDTTNNFGWFHSGSPGGYLIIDGTQWNFAGNYTSSGVATFTTQAKTIAHSADGSKTVNIQGYHNGDQSSGGNTLTSASLNFNFALTTINRTAAITVFTVDQITDTGFRINVSVDNTCDQLEYSLNGGSSYTTVAGSFTSTSVTITDKPSDTAYTVRVRVRRTDSQQLTTSGNTAVTTLTQNRFFGRRGAL